MFAALCNLGFTICGSHVEQISPPVMLYNIYNELWYTMHGVAVDSYCKQNSHNNRKHYYYYFFSF